MRKIIWVSVPLVLVAAAALVHLYFSDRGRWTTEAEYTGLARSVSENDLVSPEDPEVVMRFGPSFRHLGGQKFVLYGVADTEQHFFVETTADDELQSLYWIQFEAYLPDNSYRYDYEDSPARLNLDGFDFYVDTAAVQSDPDRKRKRGTDGARAREFLKSKGYTIPPNYAYARLVYLTDESRRKELLVIFIDNLDPLGLKGSDLQDGGKAEQRWPEIEQKHLEKIRSTLTLSRTAREAQESAGDQSSGQMP